MITEQKIMDKGKSIQKDCHEFVENAMAENPKLSYQDCTNAYLFGKLAQLELLIERLGANKSH